MKPQNKYQRFILEVNDKLKPLSKAKIEWMKKNTVWNYITNHRKDLVCMECNHKWIDGLQNGQRKLLKTVKCPSCDKRHKLIQYYPNLNTEGHGVVFDKVGDISIVRIVYVRKYMYKDKAPSFQVVEVARRFYDIENKKYAIISRGMNGMMGNYQGGWNLSSDLSLKTTNPKDYRLRIGFKADIYPQRKAPASLLRMGFNFKNEAKISHDDLIYSLITNPKTETLLKKGLHSFLSKSVYEKFSDELWSALKICFRNNYIIAEKDTSDYCDYISLLSYFGKDLKSPKYVCPKNLHKEHQRLVNKKRIIVRDQKRKERRQEIINQTEDAKRNAKVYIKRTKKYFSLLFKEKNLIIEAMKSVEEFMHAGDKLNHCIFLNGYYNKKDSLVLTAKIKGQLVETIEVDLNTFQIQQSRGYDNHPTEYNDRIIKLVSKHLTDIQKLHKKAA